MSYLRGTMHLLLNHAVCIVIVVAIMPVIQVFGYVGLVAIPLLVYSIIMYANSWNIAAADIKSTSLHAPHPLKGLKCGVYASIVAVLIWILLLIVPYGDARQYIFVAYNIWMVGFIGLFNLSAANWIVYTVALLYMPIVTYFGYRVGLTKFRIGEQLEKKFNKVAYEKKKEQLRR